MMINKKIIPVLLLLIVLTSSFIGNSPAPVKGAIEDLTTWTKVDSGLLQTVSSTRVTITNFNYDTNNDLLYKDFTDGYFGLFKINTDFRIVSQASGVSYPTTGILALSTRGATPNDFVASVESVGLYHYNTASSTTDFKLGLIIRQTSVNTVIMGTYTYTVGTTYYVSFERTGLPTVTGVCTFTVNIYSDSGRTTLLETITTATAPTMNYRWAYAWESYDGGTVGPLITAYMENFEVISVGYGQGSDGMIGGVSATTALKIPQAGNILFYAEGLYWLIYQEDTLHYVAYKTSDDNCTTWSAYADFIPNGFFPNTGAERPMTAFSFAQYGNKIGYVHSSSSLSLGIALTFRQATLSGDGSFSWDDDLQTIEALEANTAYAYPMLTYDTTGHPIVVYTKFANIGTDYTVQVVKNTYTNGTWVDDGDVTGEAWSYPYASAFYTSIEIIDADRIAVSTVDQTTDDLNLIIYDGAGWQDPILMYDGNAMPTTVDISSIGDKVFFAFIDSGSVDKGYSIYYDISDMTITSTILIASRASGILYLTKSTIEQSMYCLDFAVNPKGYNIYIFDGNTWGATTITMYSLDDPTYFTNTVIIDVMNIAIDGRFGVVTLDTYIQVACIVYVDDSSRPIVILEEITNFDDTNNLYAKYRNYTLEVSILDLEDDLEAIKVKITQAGAIRSNFLYNVTDNTFSEISGENQYTLYIGECIVDLTGDYYNLTFAFAPNWNATEESDLDLAYELKDPLFGITYGTYQTDYADTVVTLTVPSIEYLDPNSPDRININTAVVINGEVRYRSNPGANTVNTGETRTFGNTNVGNLANITNNVVYGALWTGYDGTAQNIKAYIKSSAIGKKFTCGLYTLSGTLVSQTAEYTTVGTSAGWITFTFSVPPTLTNQVYYIVIWTDDATAKIGSFSAQGTRGYFTSTYTGTLPATGTFIQDSYKYSIYCTYVTPSVTIPTAGTKFPDQSAFTEISLYDQYNNVIDTDTTIVSGDFTFNFNASAVSISTTYNVYIAMVAPDYTDAELSAPTEQIITDQVIVDFLGALDTDVTAMFNTTIYCTAYYEYDHVYLSVGDSVWLKGYQLTYDLNVGLLVGYPVVNTFVTSVTFNTVTDVDDHLYGLTVGDVTAWAVTVTWHEYSGTPTYTTTTSSCITTTYCETSVTYIVTISLTSTSSSSTGNTTIAGPITTTDSTQTVITTSFSLSTILTTRLTTSLLPDAGIVYGTSTIRTETTTARRTFTVTTNLSRTTIWTVTNYLGQTVTYTATYLTWNFGITCATTHPTTITKLWTSSSYTITNEATITKVPTVSTVTTTTLSTTYSTSFVTTTSDFTVTTVSPSTMTTTSANGTSTATIDATQVITIKTYYFYYDTVTSIADTTTTETTTTSTNSTSTKTSVTTTDTDTTSTTTSKSTSVTCTSTNTCSTHTSLTCTTTCSTYKTTTTTCTTSILTSKTTSTTCTTSVSTSRTTTITCETEVETVTDTSTLIDTCTTTCETETSVETELTTTCETVIETNSTCITTCETITDGETTCLTTTVTEETCETETSTSTSITCETVCETSEIANTTCVTTTETEETTTCTTTCSTFETCTTTCSTFETCTTTCSTTCEIQETCLTTCSTFETCTTTCSTTCATDTSVATTCTTSCQTELSVTTTCTTSNSTSCVTETFIETTCTTSCSTETEEIVTCTSTCTTITVVEDETTCITSTLIDTTCTTTCETDISITVSCTTTCDTLEFVDETSTTSCSTLIETTETTTSTCTTTTGEDTITVNVTTTTCTTLTNSLGSTSTSTITTISKTTTTTTAAGGGGAGGDTNILILPITIGAVLTVLFVALGKKRKR